ncbi:unnamed protein product [Spirodela intermedia]|uniref:C2H2-type domain-containing protein n=1 Tax=Spirodela intermedia TaxID=51605 RepID=A0A7I8IPS7_SPIIN|nr:unnamed protein product [Spirodela intermedia]CAA6659967.1 unnamed protein product [Spirodela intermedia]
MEVEGKEEGGLGFPHWVACLRKVGPHDPFFTAGNAERELLAKQLTLDLTEDERFQLQSMEDAEGEGVFCPIVGCGARLKSLNDFEDHYNARHTASCSVCSRVFPTSRLLSIHVSEAHDSFFQAKVARGFPMFECLVEGCGVKLKSYQSRHQHLVDKHKFPASFQFFRKANPSKRQRQKNHHKQVAAPRREKPKDEMEVEVTVSEERKQNRRRKQASQRRGEMMETPDTSNSAPSSISFGHRHARGFQFLPRSIERSKKTVPPTDGNV